MRERMALQEVERLRSQLQSMSVFSQSRGPGGSPVPLQGHHSGTAHADWLQDLSIDKELLDKHQEV